MVRLHFRHDFYDKCCADKGVSQMLNLDSFSYDCLPKQVRITEDWARVDTGYLSDHGQPWSYECVLRPTWHEQGVDCVRGSHDPDGLLRHVHRLLHCLDHDGLHQHLQRAVQRLLLFLCQHRRSFELCVCQNEVIPEVFP